MMRSAIAIEVSRVGRNKRRLAKALLMYGTFLVVQFPALGHRSSFKKAGGSPLFFYVKYLLGTPPSIKLLKG